MAAMAGPGDYVVTLKSASNLPAFAQQYSLFLKSVLHGNDSFLASLPSGALGNLMLTALKASPLVQSVDPDTPVQLPEVAGLGVISRTYPTSVTTCASPYVPTGKLPPPTYYQDQPAVCLVSLPAAQLAGWKGVGVRMALIDTWVDIHHPGFGGAVDLAHSMSFANPTSPVLLTQETSPMVDQETSPMVDQETSPMVDGSGTIILNQETSPMVDQETSPMVDSKNPAFAGHGTGVAGIMHLVAPQSSIVALEAFSPNTGTGSLSSIVAAIYYAVDKANVDVINMSFTVPNGTPGMSSLATAIAYAQSKGVIIVASVPDSGGGKSYPAGYDGVTSVACTDNSDQVCSFSGHVGWSDVYAPGIQVMSLYPGKRHALYTGTSFSAPFVSGTAALLNFRLSEAAAYRSQAATNALNNGDKVKGVVRLDVFQAVATAK
jgi:hypothetical protein